MTDVRGPSRYVALPESGLWPGVTVVLNEAPRSGKAPHIFADARTVLASRACEKAKEHSDPDEL